MFKTISPNLSVQYAPPQTTEPTLCILIWVPPTVNRIFPLTRPRELEMEQAEEGSWSLPSEDMLSQMYTGKPGLQGLDPASRWLDAGDLAQVHVYQCI